MNGLEIDIRVCNSFSRAAITIVVIWPRHFLENKTQIYVHVSSMYSTEQNR